MYDCLSPKFQNLRMANNAETLANEVGGKQVRISGNGGVSKQRVRKNALPNIICHRKWKGVMHNESIDTVCLEKDCLNNNEFLGCSKCREDQHAQHEHVPLQLLVHDIHTCLTDSEEDQQEKLCHIDALRREALEKLTAFKQAVMQRFHAIDLELIKQYEQLSSTGTSASSTRNNLLQNVDNFAFCQNEDLLKEKIRIVMEGAHSICDKTLCGNTNIEKKHNDILKILSFMQESFSRILRESEKGIQNTADNEMAPQKASQNINSSRMSHNNSRNEINPNSLLAEASLLQPETVQTLNNLSAYQESVVLRRDTIYEDDNASQSFPFHNNSQAGLMNNSIRQVSFLKDEMSVQTSHELNQRFDFSQSQRDSSINLSRRTLVNGNYPDQKSYYRVQVLQPDLESIIPSIKQWSFRVAKQRPHWLGFGIGHINHLKEKSFRYENTEFSFSQHEGHIKTYNHGCYFITSNGWAFAHGKLPERTPFRFSKNDIVTCRFDPFKNFLIFYKNNDFQLPFNLDFKPICWNKLHPLVIMWHSEDSIELL